MDCSDSAAPVPCCQAPTSASCPSGGLAYCNDQFLTNEIAGAELSGEQLFFAELAVKDQQGARVNGVGNERLRAVVDRKRIVKQGVKMSFELVIQAPSSWFAGFSAQPVRAPPG